MKRYIIVSLISGLLFGIMDGLIHANPLAVSLFEYYSPILRTSVNAPLGITIDLIYGFALTGFFLMFYKSLPGRSGLAKGISYGLVNWFLRVVMTSASQWIMYTVPATTLLYGLVAGLAEMLILGVLYGLTLKPR